MRADRATRVEAVGAERWATDGESAATRYVCCAIYSNLNDLTIMFVNAARVAAALRQTSGKLATPIFAWGSICFFRGGRMANGTTASAAMPYNREQIAARKPRAGNDRLGMRVHCTSCAG